MTVLPHVRVLHPVRNTTRERVLSARQTRALEAAARRRRAQADRDDEEAS